ncbi:MAG: hypothetical protein L7U72_15320 [Rubripirellula sp.]|nr:hypothetical protein [Rubripirellula sp.]
MSGRFLAFCLLVALVTHGRTVDAQLNQDTRNVILEMVKTAQTELDPDQLPSLDDASKALQEEIKQVQDYFDQHTDEKNRDAWMDYLQLSALAAALGDQGSAAELAKEAVALKDRLIGTVPGLELTVLRSLRDSVDVTINAIRFQDRERSIKLLDDQLATLGKMIETADDVPTPDQFSAISRRVDLLAAAGQASQLVAELREVFGQPNIAVRVSDDFLSQVVGRDIARTEPVSDVILGTSLTGTAVMTGAVSAKLIPSESDAQIEINLAGKVETKNDGVNGPVRLKSESEGTVSLSRVLTVNGSGIEFSDTTSDVSLTTKITDMTAKSDLALKVGKKQSVKKKPQADRIAKEKLRRRVTEQFESEMEGMKSNASSKLLNEAKPVLQRLALSPPEQKWSSSTEQIALDVIFRSSSQLSAVNAPSGFESDFLFAAQIHESVIENAFTVVLAGRTLDKELLNELLENAGAPKPETSDEEEETSFEISFSRSRPVIFEARDGKLTVGIRGTRFAQGDRTPLNKAIEITANYEVVTGEADTPILKRVGDVDVSFPGDRLSIREAGLKPIIQKEFSKIFPAVILDQSIKVAEDAELETLRGREFRSSEITASLGWLSIAFQ